MRYVLALFCPWIVFFTMGKIGQGFLCLLLQISLIGWLPATIWAFVSIGGYHADKRNDKLIAAVLGSNRHQRKFGAAHRLGDPHAARLPDLDAGRRRCRE